MEICEISSENAEEFIDLMGPDMVDDMKRVFYRGIGVKDDRDDPLAAFIYELIGSESDTETKSYIRLSKCDSAEAEEAIQKLYKENSVYEEDIVESFYELDDEKQADFFAAAGFSKEKKESNYVRTTLGEMSELSLVKKGAVPPYVDSISTLSVVQYRTAVKTCLFKGYKGILEDLAYLPMTWFDRDISSCSITGDNVDGLFLVRATPSGVLIPVLFYAYGPDSVKRLAFMLVNSINNAAKKYPPDTNIVVCRSSAAARGMMTKLMPELNGEETYTGSRKE